MATAVYRSPQFVRCDQIRILSIPFSPQTSVEGRARDRFLVNVFYHRENTSTQAHDNLSSSAANSYL
jgi:hypothetical protein